MIDVLAGGVDITQYVQDTHWSPRWNLLHKAVIEFPGEALSVPAGTEIVLDLGGAVFSGEAWYTEGSGDPDAGMVQVTAWDWSIWLRKRMCRQGLTDPDPGSMVDVSPVIEGNITAPEIAAAFVQNSIDIDPNPPPVTIGTVDTGGVDLTSVPMAFPMTIDRMITLLTSTGQLIVERVPDPGNNSVTLNFLNPYENDLSGSVTYGYGTGAFNAQTATYTVDLDDIVNALWYFLGRRFPGPPTDPAPAGRWPGSITATAPHAGGSWPAALLTRISDSRAAWGYAQEIQILDDYGDENDIREMFEERWANEAWVRALPREFGSVMPEVNTVPNFAVGDTIGVAGDSSLNGGFSGSQRVYGFDLSCDVDGNLIWDDITTSADQEGAEAVDGG